MTEEDLTPQDWRAICLSCMKYSYALGKQYGFWSGMLIGWLLGGSVVLLLQ